jgi:LPS-assembly lipoprotein
MTARRALLVVAALALAGCGFHLRGDVAYAFTSLYLNAPADNPLTPELRRAIEGTAHTRLTETAVGAEVVLDVTAVGDDKQVLSLSGGGRVREFLLIKRATIGLHDAEGRDWLPAAEITVRRTYTFNEAQVLAREAQEAREKLAQIDDDNEAPNRAPPPVRDPLVSAAE